MAITVDNVNVSYEQLSKLSKFSPIRKKMIRLFLQDDHPDIDQSILDSLKDELVTHSLYELVVHSVLVQQEDSPGLSEDNLVKMLWHRKNLEDLYISLKKEDFISFESVLADVPSAGPNSDNWQEGNLSQYDDYWAGVYWFLFYIKYNDITSEPQETKEKGQLLFGRYLINEAKCIHALELSTAFTNTDSSFAKLQLAAYKASCDGTELKFDVSTIGPKYSYQLLKFFNELKNKYGLYDLYDIWTHHRGCIKYLCPETRTKFLANILEVLSVVDDYTIALEYIDQSTKRAIQTFSYTKNIEQAKEVMQKTIKQLREYGIYREEFKHIQNIIIKKCEGVQA